jgi:hypothetical protein
MLVGLALALPSCGSDDEATAPQKTTTAAASRTPTATAATDRPTKAEREAEVRREFYLALDDQAIAFDDVLGRALDGDANADAALAKIRRRVTDLVHDYTADGGNTTAGITAFQGAIADAVSALNSSDRRKMVEARVAGQKARAQFTDDLVGPQ